jgi:ribose-phosphate pyrophosphokinase
MLSLYIDKQQAEVNIFKFPAGESGVSFCTNSIVKDGKVNACITLKWQGNDDIVNLALLVDAVRREYDVDLSLNIPYFPYARQDRVCNKGESLSLKVITNMVNAMEFSSVYVTDPHSDVLGALLNNMVCMDVVPSLIDAMFKVANGGVNLVSPDAGANKKVLGYAKRLGGMPVIRADKTRDTKTGSITGTVVFSEHIGNVPVVVVDDIGDGMGTFIPLAAELRKITNGTVSIFLSHGIFTKSVDILQGVFDNIFVVNNMYGSHPLITEV